MYNAGKCKVKDSATKSKQRGDKGHQPLTWQRIILVVVVVWLIGSFIFGEQTKVGQAAFNGGGCSVKIKQIERNTRGLPLRESLIPRK